MPQLLVSVRFTSLYFNGSTLTKMKSKNNDERIGINFLQGSLNVVDSVPENVFVPNAKTNKFFIAQSLPNKDKNTAVPFHLQTNNYKFMIENL